MRCVLFILLLAGCVDPAEVEGGAEPVTRAWECDYELDDYAGGQPRLMVHWDIEGDRAMSGIPFQVDLLHDGAAVARHVTTTDCSLFEMDGLDADTIIVNPQDPQYCDWGAVEGHAYTGGFDTVRVELVWVCG